MSGVNKEYYQLPYANSNMDFVLRRHQDIDKILKNKKIGDSFSEEEKDSLLSYLERSAIAIRGVIEKEIDWGCYSGAEEIKNSKDKFYKKLPVKVDFYNNQLHLFTPPTVKRKGKKQDAFNINGYLLEALETWVSSEENSKKIRQLKPPFCVCIVRRSFVVNATIRDNDNLENSRAINAIFKILGFSDNVLNMDLFCTYKKAQVDTEVGMEFILMEQKDFPLFLKNFKSN